MSTTFRPSLLRVVSAVALTAAAVLPVTLPSTAHAWWRGGWGWHGGIFIGPPVVVGPPVVYAAPPPVVYAAPPVYYPGAVWIAPHWVGGVWIRGHWR